VAFTSSSVKLPNFRARPRTRQIGDLSAPARSDRRKAIVSVAHTSSPSGPQLQLATEASDAENDCGHDTEERHHRGQQNGRDDKHLRANALDILAFDDCEELFHAASVTFVMKISLRLGSTISNFPITAPESIKRFSSVCASLRQQAMPELRLHDARLCSPAPDRPARHRHLHNAPPPNCVRSCS
jgi:hypothetical protein